MFKIGIGPSSSHTVGPMRAGGMFIRELETRGLLAQVTRLQADVYGSLSLTGRGHHTDLAIILGLAGYEPDTVDIAFIPGFIKDVETRQRLPIAKARYEVDFPRDRGLVFHENALPLHENGMELKAFNGDEELLVKTYYSIGGGFVVDAVDFEQKVIPVVVERYPFNNAADLLKHCQENDWTLSELVMENEKAYRTEQEISEYFERVWQTMQDCIQLGLKNGGVLPGPLEVPRRAPTLYKALTEDNINANDPMRIIDWVNMFALAVSEENAAGGRVVTAPTNGACGIIPAVLAYYNQFVQPLKRDHIVRFFLASGVVGLLYKMNASISGAEVGCQGEVGVACSMAAAGLAEIMGATPERVCMAAEIGMEHNLGLTCDPVAGQVQVPCIERNAIAAIKAINSARMAMQRDSAPCVSLDTVIETMYETGRDMNTKYRETSCGGLALKVGCGGFCGSSTPCS
ncbi:L-serine ammonia-lyase [Microvirga sp. W0021]|uniref:L-serine dehydratase n=1 Tax=Hohaiivirga grylli TaxID=3133970 RepID=A0ABV0BH07_9HYPH